VLEILEAINNGGIHHGPTPMQINGVSPAPVPATNAVGGIFGATYVISNAQAEEAHQSTGRVDTNPGAITVISTDYLDPPEILQEATGPSTNKIGELLEYSVKNNLNPPTYEEVRLAGISRWQTINTDSFVTLYFWGMNLRKDTG
jgi:hypothetical protein